MNASKRKHCKSIIENDYRNFLKKKNVVGLAFGNKVSNNIDTKIPSLVILVSVKETEANLNSNDLIPKTYKGLTTDVIQTGKLHYTSLTEKQLPLKFGYGVGPNNLRGVGTAGCLVKDISNNYYILSNNHVLSYGDRIPIGTPVLYPAVHDGGTYPEDLIAILAKTVPTLTSSEFEGREFINYVDCAIAKVINPALVTKEIAQVGPINGIAEATIDLSVKKVGRSSELTTGKIIELDALITLKSPDDEEILYTDQIVTTSMSEPGDSGSLLLDDNNNAVGLLFGAGENTTFFNPIQSVLTALNVSIVTK